jgi:hypothetical protein
MISKTTLEELKEKILKIYIKSGPEKHSVHSGRIEMVTEYIVKIYNDEHNNYTIIPIDNIAFIRLLQE